MGMRGSQHIAAGVRGGSGIIDIAASAAQQPLVFFAPHRLPDRLYRHYPPSTHTRRAHIIAVRRSRAIRAGKRWRGGEPRQAGAV